MPVRFRSSEADGFAAGFVGVAVAIADDLAASLSSSSEMGRRLGFEIYEGAVGIALLLGACERVVGSGRWRDVALRILSPVRQTLARLTDGGAKASDAQFPLGGFAGLGSLIYGFLLLADWAGEPGLRSEAVAATQLVTPERIAGDERFDLMSGSAGLILALLAVEQELRMGRVHGPRGSSPLDLAIACGEHLLAHQTSHEDLPPAWPGPAGRPPLTGFAHGATGICYALLRLYALSGVDDFRRAALTGFEFEHQLYDSRVGNWIDPRTGGWLEQSAWCHGAPGVALGRIGGLAEVRNEEVIFEIDLHLEATRRSPLSPRDHLCCGNMGRIEILFQAGRVLDREPFPCEREARDLAERTLRRAQGTGRFALESVQRPGAGGTSIANPTFFRGTAGVGYTLLRLATPDSLPSILLLEYPCEPGQQIHRRVLQ